MNYTLRAFGWTLFVCANPTPHCWRTGRLPVRQTLLWLGPLFFALRPRFPHTGRSI